MRWRSLPTTSLVAVTAIWGATFVVVADVITQMPVFAFLAWRFGIATVLLLLLRPQAVLALSTAEVRRGAFLGLLLGVGYLAQTFGLETVSPTVSGFLTALFVVFTPFLAWASTRERIAARMWLAVILAAAGAATMTFAGGGGLLLGLGWGECITIIGALLFAGHIVGLSRWSNGGNAYGLAVVQLGTVTLVCAGLSAMVDDSFMPPTAQVWVAIFFLAVAATAIAFVVQTWAQSRLAPSRAAVILMMEPVFALITGVIVGEALTRNIFAGGFLVLIAVYISEIGVGRWPRSRADSGKSQPIPHIPAVSGIPQEVAIAKGAAVREVRGSGGAH